MCSNTLQERLKFGRLWKPIWPGIFRSILCSFDQSKIPWASQRNTIPKIIYYNIDHGTSPISSRNYNFPKPIHGSYWQGLSVNFGEAIRGYQVLKERPRHIILRDVNDVKEKVCRKGLKQSLPPFLLLGDWYISFPSPIFVSIGSCFLVKSPETIFFIVICCPICCFFSFTGSWGVSFCSMCWSNLWWEGMMPTCEELPWIDLSKWTHI